MKPKDFLESITDFNIQEAEDGVNKLFVRMKSRWYTVSVRDFIEIDAETGRRWKRKHVIVESGRKKGSEAITRKPKSEYIDYHNRNGHYRAGPSMNRKGQAEREEN
jgi:hypothetical protein